jgi:[ribosomal protein S18]-alanine N-acetyltransferase
MSRDTIETGLGWSWRPARVLASIRDSETLAIVAGPERVRGFCIAQFGDESVHLSLLAVNATWRRQGLGRELVNWILASARAAGIAVVNVEMRLTNSKARAFYSALGFEEAGVVAGYYRGIESALRMILRLRAGDLPKVVWEPPLAWRRREGS